MRQHKTFPAAFFSVILVFSSMAHAACTTLQQYNLQTEKLLSQLPPGKRRILSDTLKSSEHKNKSLHDEIHRLEAERVQLLASPNFDQRTYLDKSAKLGRLIAKMHAQMDDAIALIASQFTPEERMVLIKINALEHKEWLSDERETDSQPETEE